MKRVSGTFLTGIVVGIPIILTIAVIWQTGVWLNGLAVGLAGHVSEPLGTFMGRVPGLGILLILAAIFMIGVAARFWMTAWALKLAGRFLASVPLVKTVYTSIRDMLRFFGGEAGEMGKVVLYSVPETSACMLAILTNEEPVGLPADQSEQKVAIWLPMSYMLGGYMLYVPADSVQPLDMSMERLMKLATTAEVGAQKITDDD